MGFGVWGLGLGFRFCSLSFGLNFMHYLSVLHSAEFLKRADASCSSPEQTLPSPVIPNGYDRVARWHMDRWGGGVMGDGCRVMGDG